MTYSKILLAVFMGCFSLFLLSSCTKDDSKVSNVINDTSSEIRTNTPGSSSGAVLRIGNYSVVNGRVKFFTVEDFQQTVSYLESATNAEIESFRSSISIETPAKAMKAFADATCCEIELTNSQMEAIENQFASKVKITINSEGDKEVNLKFVINPEFTNLDGEYQVGNTIIKQIGTKLISVTKPNITDPRFVTESTITNAANGIFVTETVLASPLGCCPFSNRKDCEHDPKKKKFIMKYDIKDITQTVNDPFDPNRVLVMPQIIVRAEGKHERRKCFIICWWTCDKVNLKHDFTITFTHNWSGLGLALASNPISFTGSVTTFECNIIHEKRFPGTPFSTVTGFPPPLDVCVTDVHQKVTNLNNGKVCTFDCQM